MSDSNTPPESPQAAPNPSSGADHGHQFEEYKKKLLGQIADLGNHVDGLQTKLAHAAGQVKTLIEKELAELKAHHPEAFAKLDELRLTGDEGIDILRTRLDKLAGDLEKAVGTFIGTLAEQTKKATGHDASKPAAGDAGQPEAKPAEPTAPTSSDKPAT